jgi:predicted nucleic acid-binding protein
MADILVDSSVILDVFENDPTWCEWSLHMLEEHGESNRLIINQIIYTEISIGFDRIKELDDAISQSGLKILEIPKEALFLTGKVFLKYRRKKGTKVSPLPDFFIGAHAAIAKAKLLTRDTKRISCYFPSVELLSPTEN